MIHNKRPGSVNKINIKMILRHFSSKMKPNFDGLTYLILEIWQNLLTKRAKMDLGKFCSQSLYPILLITLSGCTIFNDQPRPVKWETKAEKISTPIDIKFKRGSATLSTSTKNAIRANIATPHETYFRLYGENSNTSSTRINNVMAYLDTLGVPRANIDILRQSDDVTTSPNTLTLIIDHYQIIPPKCPGWQEMNTSVPPTGEINFRCTNEKNLSAMIADPRVVISGNELAGIDANRSNKSIENYQADTVKKIKIEKIDNSNVG